MAATDAHQIPRRFAEGTVIPAHPLALDANLRLDERRQRALTRYYLDAGAGGLAVGVHTTQFAIHKPGSGLLGPVLELAAETARSHPDPAIVLVAGVCGPVSQAVAETELAARLGYHAVLLAPPNIGTGRQDVEDALLARAAAVGEVLPVIGFYLQPAVGGVRLSRRYWSRLADLRSVIGIKVAPFDRYATIDVLAGVAESSRADEITLYTGNDDHIIGDLLVEFPTTDGGSLSFLGGLLGQWSVWTRCAVELLASARKAADGDTGALTKLRRIDGALTDANGAIFDRRNEFRGCVPGIHEVLRRQGLLAGTWCLDPDEVLSPGQLDEIDRIWQAYPTLRDDEFVAARIDRWMA